MVGLLNSGQSFDAQQSPLAVCPSRGLGLGFGSANPNPGPNPHPKPGPNPNPHQVPIAGETAYEVTRFACGEQGTAVVLSDGSIYACGMHPNRCPNPNPNSNQLLSDGSIYVWGMQRFFEPTLLPGERWG